VKPKRKRDIQLHFMVTEKEKALIFEKMARLGIKNMGAYLRKMALDGYVVTLDLSNVRELVFLLRNATNNLNQIARRANETGSIYEADIQDLRQNYDRLWDMAGKILTELSDIR